MVRVSPSVPSRQRSHRPARNSVSLALSPAVVQVAEGGNLDLSLKLFLLKICPSDGDPLNPTLTQMNLYSSTIQRSHHPARNRINLALPPPVVQVPEGGNLDLSLKLFLLKIFPSDGDQLNPTLTQMNLYSSTIHQPGLAALGERSDCS